MKMFAGQPNFNLGSENTSRLIAQSGFIGIGQALSNTAKAFPDRVAIEDDSCKLTFAQLNSRCNTLANALALLGLARGNRIAVLAENRIEYGEIVYAAAKLGLAVPCLNWRLSPAELQYCINLVKPEIIAVSSMYRNAFLEIRNELPSIKRVILLDGDPATAEEISYSALFKNIVNNDVAVDLSPEDALLVIYTSGTTGYPKATIISHRAYFGRAWTWVKDLNLRAEDTFLGWPPMFHIASMDNMIIMHIIGGKFICVPGWDAEKILHYILKERLGWLALGPGIYEPLIDLLSKSQKRAIGVKYVGAMADLTPPNTIAEITKLLNAPFLNTFGATETGAPPATNSTLAIGKVPSDFSKKINSTCQIRLVDREDQDVALGEPGELAIRGASVCSGYWGDEDTNKEDFRGGWFHLGDVFTMNPNGTINFVDRRKYVIKSGGENIYPAEIERVLLQHPAVLEAAVVRYPDPKWGETPKAYIATSKPISKEEILDLCKKNLAGYKKPRYVEFIALEKFPRSTSGKVQRHEIEKWHKT